MGTIGARRAFCAFNSKTDSSQKEQIGFSWGLIKYSYNIAAFLFTVLLTVWHTEPTFLKFWLGHSGEQLEYS